MQFEYSTEHLLQQLVARILPEKLDAPISFLVTMLEALAAELKKLDVDHAGFLCGFVAPPGKLGEPQASQRAALNSSWQEKELKVLAMNGESICKVAVKSHETLVELMQSVNKITEIPLDEQQYTITAGQEPTVLIDMLEPLEVLLAPLDNMAEPSLVMIRRNAEHAQWMQKVLKGSYGALADAPPEAKADPAIALAFLQMHPISFDSLLSLCIEDKSEDVEKDDADGCKDSDMGFGIGRAKRSVKLPGFPVELGSNRDFILGAMKCKQEERGRFSGRQESVQELLLDCAAPDIRQDREVLLAAVANSGDSSPEMIAKLLGTDRQENDKLQSANHEAVGDGGGGMALKNKPPEIDFGFALDLVKQGGYGTLAALPEEFRSNDEIACAAVSKDVFALKECLKRGLMMPSREVILAAVKKDPEEIMETLQRSDVPVDREIVLAAVRSDGLMLQYAPDKLRADRQVVLEAVKQNRMAVRWINHEMPDGSGEDYKPWWLQDMELWKAVAMQQGEFVLWSKLGAEAPEMLVATPTPYDLVNIAQLGAQKMSLVHVNLSNGLASMLESDEHDPAEVGGARRRNYLNPLYE